MKHRRLSSILIFVRLSLLLFIGGQGCRPHQGTSVAETLAQHGVQARIDGSLRARPYLASWLSDALAIWLADERDGESLRSIVRWVGARDDDSPCREPEVQRQIRCWLGRPGTSIGIDHASPTAARFWLAVPALSDHIFFVDMSRQGHILRARSWGEN